MAAVGLREEDGHDDLNGFILAAMVEGGLLGTEVTEVAIGVLCGLDERGQDGDGGDVWTGLGDREVLGVFIEQQNGEGTVVALT